MTYETVVYDLPWVSYPTYIGTLRWLTREMLVIHCPGCKQRHVSTLVTSKLPRYKFRLGTFRFWCYFVPFSGGVGEWAFLFSFSSPDAPSPSPREINSRPGGQ